MAVKDRAAGKELDGIVEYIMDAGRMQVLMGPPYHIITFNLSGVKCLRSGARRWKRGSGPIRSWQVLG